MTQKLMAYTFETQMRQLKNDTQLEEETITLGELSAQSCPQAALCLSPSLQLCQEWLALSC